MKIVYIHGIGGDADVPLARAIRSEFKDFYPIEYYELSKKPGWVAEVFHRVYDKIPKEPHILVGESLGGLLAVYSKNSFTKGLVLISPALAVNMGVHLFLITEVMKRKYVTIASKHPVRMNKEDVDTFFKLMKNPPLPRQIPTLFIVAEEDNLIDNRGVHKYFSSTNTQRAWYVEVAGAEHTFAEREHEVVEIMKTFLNLYVDDFKISDQSNT